MKNNSEHISNFPIKDRQVLERLLPHRDPFVMVDTLRYYDEDQLESSFTIPEDNLLVENSFFSEAGLIENMAQSIALHTGYKGYLSKLPAREGYIAAIKNVKITKLPKVNQTINTKVTIIYAALEMSQVAISIFLDTEVIAEATMSTMLKKEMV